MSTVSCTIQFGAIYTEFKVAFDKIPHALRIARFAKLGVSSNILEWLHSFLANRICKVKWNRSNEFHCTSVVPLSVLLFLLFVNDVCSVPPSSGYLMFADNLKFFARFLI